MNEGNNTVIYILIIIIGGFSSQSGYSTVVAEFNSLQACEAARKHIVESAAGSKYGGTNDNIGQLRSHGCHAKGLPS